MKVEVAAPVVQRWILARLRHLGTTRRALFESIERDALLPMPAVPYAYAERRRCRAGLDYHVEVYGRLLLRALPPDARGD